MILKKYLPLIIVLLMFSCGKNTVTNSNDYSKYLSEKADKSALIANAQQWTDKLNENPNQYPYLGKRAAAYTKVFDATGDIDYLIKAEKDLKQAVEITKGKTTSYLKSLASNYISQHRFKEALELLKQAEENGDKLTGTQKMLFDVHLELGNYLLAESYLKGFKNISDFDYLIRLAKWEDHIGNLEGAILNMEKAKDIAEASNLKGMKQWSYTNLADFYGHAGEIEKSYNLYLKALEIDATDAYAKKGIAWIAFSYENNPIIAQNIIDSITTYYTAPDYQLLMAEIADYNEDELMKTSAIGRYNDMVENKNYGDMYNAYNIIVYTEEMLLPERAIEMANQEVENRPTPQSYDLLAWSYFKNGNVEMANEIIEKHVDGQTFEPAVLYHIAEIYKAKGKSEAVADLKKELVASLYELGPTMESKINQL
ncbi:tetratricopeptide repeat protein [Winogradskyella marincola]|uniref:Cell surface protein n=1 Tax=Winogradskyella marincola TaxID=3037795 RepID=A0ABT6G2N5_9FLAO|nr:cell surface protein [Winogradskyella sp. YYF002]MDG4716307.1 cell surface protein [Winogradskyella sp. YYF002]